MAEMTRRTRRLTVIAAWFIEQLLLAKKIYMTIVMAKEIVYIPSVDPINIDLHAFESYFSIFSKQNSAQVCARSTKRMRPRRTKSIAPAKAKYLPQTWKNASGMKKVRTTRASQAMILGPQ